MQSSLNLVSGHIRWMALLRKQLSSSHFKSSSSTNIRYFKRQSLPPGTITEFVWKDYSSAFFRKIQELGDVSYDDYIFSICRHETLMELALRGGCGRPFYLSHDQRFVIKSLPKSEAKVLIDMLPSYYTHLKKHEKSLLVKFYGLHAARPIFGGEKVYFVVMENMLQTELPIHRRYDLKGSSQGRSPCKAGCQPKLTLKDLDFDLRFYLEPPTHSQLLEQIKVDCKFLEEQGVMDYSLLLGVHIEPQGPQRLSVTTDERFFLESSNIESTKEPTPDDSIQAHDESDVNSDKVVESRHRRDPTLSDFFLSASGPDSRFGTKLPARAIQLPQESTTKKARVPACPNVYLYLGIIDFLQSYNVIKRIEHVYKSLHYNPKAIPSVNPKLYATRFQDFLCNVFLEDELNPSPELYLHKDRNTTWS